MILLINIKCMDNKLNIMVIDFWSCSPLQNYKTEGLKGTFELI